MGKSLETGSEAPDFEAETYGGEKLRLSDLYSQGTVALYFYPRDNTPGCTKEACSLRDGKQSLSDIGVQVVGVSTDGVKSHENFRDKHSLNFPLVSDQSKQIIDLYGVKSKFGSARRVTFLIDGEGRIRHIWNKVKTSEHADEITNKVKELGL